MLTPGLQDALTKTLMTGEPEQVMPGVRVYQNPGNRYTCVLLRYDADPQSASFAERHEGLDEASFRREHGLSFETFGGKPVYRGFDPDKHVSDTKAFHIPGQVLLRGWDFGYHHPAVVWVQVNPGFRVLGELLGEDVPLDEFVRDFVLPYEEAVFGTPEEGKKRQVLDFGDPAGNQVNDKSKWTSFSVLANHGIFVRSRKSEIGEGLEILRGVIARNELWVHPRCRLLTQGFRGGYRYPEPTKQNPNPLKPLKDGYFDHLQDALRYLTIHQIRLRTPPAPPPSPDPDVPGWDHAMRQRSTSAFAGDWD